LIAQRSRETRSGVSTCSSEGGSPAASELTLVGEMWVGQGTSTRCTAPFSVGGRRQVALHERTDDEGNWVPSMKVVLTKVG
jgi:hypothetical protein